MRIELCEIRTGKIIELDEVFIGYTEDKESIILEINKIPYAISLELASNVAADILKIVQEIKAGTFTMKAGSSQN